MKEIKNYYLNKNTYDKNKIREWFFVDKNNIRQGSYKSYDIDQNPEIECNYVNGKLDGLYIEHGNGHIDTKCNYVNGKLNGLCLEYYTNGNLIHEFTYVNGKIEGIYRVYDPYSKQVKYEYNYINDIRNGWGFRNINVNDSIVKEYVYYENDIEVDHPISMKNANKKI